jgi:hypothetical protein
MPTIDYAMADLTVDETVEGEVAFTACFVDQDPIDGGLTVVDLTESSCRWPSGRAILRRSGTAASARTAALTVNAMRISPTCGNPPDLAAKLRR